MTKIVSHRGAAGLALENSLESIKAALKLPVYAIEIDVRHTADGQLVLMHGHHTGHVSDKTLIVHNSTLKELKKLTLNNGEQIPTLDEVLKLVGSKKTVMIDIKSPHISEEMLRVLAKHPKTKVFFTGLQYHESQKLRKARPDLTFLVQHHYDPIEIIHKAKRFGARGISLNLWIINPLTYYLARQSKLEVFVYTLNPRWLLRFFKIFYPDAVIITNHPERML